MLNNIKNRGKKHTFWLVYLENCFINAYLCTRFQKLKALNVSIQNLK